MRSDPASTFAANRDRYIAEWKELVSFPSISADPAHEADCVRCAEWISANLKRIGFESRLLPTSTKPVVYAARSGKAGRPVVLFYGHYDVQPIDPLDEWTSPPFAPEIRDGRLYGRGAQDNKGQLLYALKAMEALIRENALDVTVRIIIEGEEECGGHGISEVLARHADLFKADVLMITDTGTVDSGDPTITMSLRGVVHLTVRLSGPLHDLHSGVHGGVAPNPALHIARLMATLHNPDGSIAVAGFADSLVPPTELERTLLQTAPFDEARYRAQTGVAPVGGEQRFSPAERLGFRPTIEINGIHSGYGGSGIKTIIPASAEAKITSRLVAGQDPRHCLDCLVKHLEAHAPQGLRLDITERGVSGPGLKLNPESPLVAKAGRVLREVTGKKAVFRWEGASIPVVSELSHASGAEPLLIGFGGEADRIHAPNESFSLEQFRLGYLYVASMLRAL